METACTFFGHSDAPPMVIPLLQVAIRDLIENRGVKVFYVGTHGAFDMAVRNTLRDLQEEYSEMRYHVVLSYIPTEQTLNTSAIENTLVPEGIELVPKRVAITWKNKWMLNRSQYVITYVVHSWGGAAQFKELAEKQKKTVVELSSW